MVDMSGYNSVHLSFCPTWGGTIPVSEHVTVEDYHAVVGFWQEAIRGWAKTQGENELLRKRISVLEAQVAERGM